MKTYDRVNILLAGLYYFYHNSALKRAVLQKTYEATKSQDEKLLIPTRVGGARWIGHSHRHNSCNHTLQIHCNPYGTGMYFIHRFWLYFLIKFVFTNSSDAKAKSKCFWNSWSPKLLLDSCFLCWMSLHLCVIYHWTSRTGLH